MSTILFIKKVMIKRYLCGIFNELHNTRTRIMQNIIHSSADIARRWTPEMPWHMLFLSSITLD